MLQTIYSSKNYRWFVFAAIGLGSITHVIHVGSISIALPTIAREFNVSLTTIQWVVLAESLTLSAMLLPMGRLSDIIGRKPMYLSGITLFGLMALLSGSSPWIAHKYGFSYPILLMIPFRILQGVGAALTQANGMAMVPSTFSAKERGKSLGAHGSIIGAGGIIGPILGGVLVTYLSWHWIFWINLPLCTMTFLGILFLLDSSRFARSDQRDKKYDWIGATLSSSALLIFLLTLSNGGNFGWSSPPIIVGFLVFIGSIFSFIWWESKSSSPMLDLSLFSSRGFSIGVGSNFLSFLGVHSFRFLITFYLQAALRLTPAQISLVLIPNAISRIILGPLSGNFSDKFGTKLFTTIGLFLAGCGLLLMSFMTDKTPIWYVIFSILVMSSGSSLFISPNSAAIFSSAKGNKYGVTSALVNLSRNSGNVTGIAIATAIVSGTMLSSGFSSNVEEVMTSSTGSPVLLTFISGMQTVFVLMAGLQFLSSLAHLTTRRPNIVGY